MWLIGYVYECTSVGAFVCTCVSVRVCMQEWAATGEAYMNACVRATGRAGGWSDEWWNGGRVVGRDILKVCF